MSNQIVIPKDQVVVDYNIAHSAGWESNSLKIGRDINQRGVLAFINDDVIPFIQSHGFKRVHFHNPFGAPGALMPFNQYGENYKNGDYWANEGWLEGLRRLSGMTDQVIMYIGSPQFYRDMTETAYRDGGWKPDESVPETQLAEWLDWAMYQMEPILAQDSNVEVFFDVTHNVAADSRTHRLLQLLNTERRVGVEPVPNYDHDHLWKFSVYARDRFLTNNPYTAVVLPYIEGEAHIFAGMDGNYHEWVQRIQQYIEMGYYVHLRTYQIERLIANGVSFA